MLAKGFEKLTEFCKSHKKFRTVMLLSALLIVVAATFPLIDVMTATPDFLVFVVVAEGVFLLVLMVFFICQSVMLEKAGEQRQKDSVLLQNRLQAMEASSDGIGIVDEAGYLIYANAAFLKLLGIQSITGQDEKNRSWEEVFGGAWGEAGSVDVFKKLRSKGYLRIESSITDKKTGEAVFLEKSFSRLPEGGFIGTVRDVTAQKKADQDNQELEKQFFQAQKMEAVGRLAGGVAHDFNNILAAMNGYAEFLVDDLDKDTPQHGFAEKILKAGMQARLLVDQMLTFSRRDDMLTQVIDIVIPVRESLNMIGASFPKNIEIRHSIKTNEAPVLANASRLTQLIMNLVVNAGDAIDDKRGVIEINLSETSEAEMYQDLPRDIALPDPEGEPVIKIIDKGLGKTVLSLGNIKTEQDYFLLEVSDTGTGISRTTMEHIFEPFFTTKIVGKGTGLGLATVHGVVASYSGAMIIESEVGKGTVFKLFFPKADTQVSESIESGSGMLNSISARILLVEDQEDVVGMMGNLLERLGHEVSTAENGLIALDMIRENPDEYDLVITDQNMPKMTGMELAEQVALDFPDMPFIVISGYSLEKLQTLIEEHPSIKYVLRKPARKSEVVAAIASVMEEKRAAA